MSDLPAHPVRRVVWKVCAVAAAVLLAGLIAVDIHLAWNVIRTSRVERETAKLRTWEPTAIAIRADQLRIPGGRGPFLMATIETRCSGSRLYYTLSVRKNPQCCAAATGDGPWLECVLVAPRLRKTRGQNVRKIEEGLATLGERLQSTGANFASELPRPIGQRGRRSRGRGECRRPLGLRRLQPGQAGRRRVGRVSREE